MKFFLVLFIALFVAANVVADSEEKRIALLVGNSAYPESVGSLTNPVKDIQLIRDSLIDIGFHPDDVTVVENSSRQALRRAIATFSAQAQGLNETDVAFFYYSGHGVSGGANNKSFVVPVDAPPLENPLFFTEALEIEADILSVFSGSESEAAWIVVLDACRNEIKLPTKSLVPVSSNFSSLPTSSGMVVAYSAELGETASDGRPTDAGGPYAVALAQALRLPNASIFKVFNSTRTTVLQTTRREQDPYYRVQLNVDDLYLNPMSDFLTDDDRAWELMKRIGSYQAYLDLFPNGTYSELARANVTKSVSSGAASGPPVWSQFTVQDWSYKPGNLLIDAAMSKSSIDEIAAAAVRGDPNAAYLLATLFYDGVSEIEIDFSIAASFYRAACQMEHMRACAALGDAYDNGRGVDENDELAVEYARRTCESGIAIGCTNLGFHYRRGAGVERDIDRALLLYDASCKQQDPLGCANAGYLFFEGLDDVPEDKPKGVRLWEVACSGGEMVGCANLGWAYLVGAVVDQDGAKAESLLQAACDGGQVRGCFMLANALSNGNVINLDADRATALFERACSLGSKRSCDRTE